MKLATFDAKNHANLGPYYKPLPNPVHRAQTI